MAYPSENRPASTPGAEPPMPELPADLAAPAPPSAPPPSGVPAGTSSSVPPGPASGVPAGPSSSVPPGPGSGVPADTSSSVSSDVERAPYVPPPGDVPATGTPVEKHEKIQLGRTRTSAMWFGVWAGVVGVLLLIIFVAQNTAPVEVNFLWMSGSISLALALLIAGVAGAAIAMGVAAARIIQLRRLFRRSR
jgi:uncharacterized integral membrane protein